MNSLLALTNTTKNTMKYNPFLIRSLLYTVGPFIIIYGSIFSIKIFITSTMMAWSGLELRTTQISTPLTKRSNQIIFVVNLMSDNFLIGYLPMESTLINPLTDESHTVGKTYIELLNVSNCANVYFWPEYNILMIIYTYFTTPQMY